MSDIRMVGINIRNDGKDVFFSRVWEQALSLAWRGRSSCCKGMLRADQRTGHYTPKESVVMFLLARCGPFFRQGSIFSMCVRSQSMTPL